MNGQRVAEKVLDDGEDLGQQPQVVFAQRVGMEMT
jgi:hypothetical protein